MGQEKSLPDCCNYQRDHKDTSKSKLKTLSHPRHSSRTYPPLPVPHSSSSERDNISPYAVSSSLKHNNSASSTITSISKKGKDHQKNYLEHHLYIKSYLDILDEDTKAKKKFKPARPGIRNYTPKILSDQQKSREQSGREQNETWI